MRKLFGCLMLAALVSSCATQNQKQVDEDPLGWGRFDCRHPGNDLAVLAALNQELEQAKAICLPRGQAAAIAGTTGIHQGPGLSGAIVAGIESGIAQRQISDATITSCMAERGYQLRKTSVHRSLCPVIQPPPTPPAKPAKQQRRGTPKPPGPPMPTATAEPPE